ncbi:MAG: hypothetical protein JST00_14465 [Deltaproteobacteria bacterium]|nr:hypothetical protein [Deltaproteobacteria bacterium]
MRPTCILAIVASLLLPACTGTDRATAPPASAGPHSAPTSAHEPPAQSASKMDEGTSPAPVAAPVHAPAEPPYDLEADRQRRAATAKAELGPRTSVAVVSDIFVVIGPPGWQGAAFDQSVSLMKSSMAAYMNQRFAKKPERAISVYLFAEAQSYERFCKQKYEAPCIAHYGFYQPSDRYMVMNAGLGLGTLTHEIVHPLVESDFPGAPTWINEGIASLFEAPMITKPGEIHGAKNWRHPRLKRAMTSAAEKDHARLDTLFGMADTTFRGDGEDLHYALARYVCQWLDERGKLWAFYQRWRDTAATDPTGAKAFEEVVGMTPAAANVPWSKWALAL